MFTSTYNKGFHMKLPNGVTVSVQWGPGNYCSKRYAGSATLDTYMDPLSHTKWHSKTAEVMAWTDETYANGIRVKGVEYDSSDYVIGHLDVAQVIDFINKAAEMFNGE